MLLSTVIASRARARPQSLPRLFSFEKKGSLLRYLLPKPKAEQNKIREDDEPDEQTEKAAAARHHAVAIVHHRVRL